MSCDDCDLVESSGHWQIGDRPEALTLSDGREGPASELLLLAPISLELERKKGYFSTHLPLHIIETRKNECF